MANDEIAKRYASAIYNIAKSSESINEVREVLNILKENYAEEEEFRKILEDPLKKFPEKEKFLEKVKKNDFDGLFEEKSVKKGDFIDITPGTVHASLKGSVIFAEIQQNSDVTYRIYDFDRIDKNGKKRELHLQDSADVIDFGKEVEIKNTDFDESENGKDILRKNIIGKEYYSIDKIRFNGSFEDVNNESMTIYSFLEGEGKIVWGDNEELSVKKGETILIPAGIKTKTVGKFEILRTII